MTTPQDQYMQAFKQTQDTMKAAFDSWTHAFQQGLGQVPGATAVDPKQVVDPVYDFAAMVISRIRRVKVLPRLASSAPFLCLIEAHLEWPDMCYPLS